MLFRSVAIGKIGLTIIKGLGSAIWSKVKAAAEGIKERFLAPINALKERIASIVETIKGFFHFSISAPHVPLPHFSISPAGWKVGDLLKGSIPSLGVSWYKEGGIFDKATLAGIGEAGPEAVVPLDKFWNKMDEAKGTQITNYINIYDASDPEGVADALTRKLSLMMRSA